ncbi:MAG: DUF748 domain-containing protein [Mangrovibacterium sp.]
MEKQSKFRIRKRYVAIIIIVVLLISAMVALPPLARNYLVQHGEELTGRRIALEELSVNYFNVSITANNFDLFEQNKKDVFVHFDQLHLDFDPWRLLQKEFKFSEISLWGPRVSLRYSGSGFNFSDLVSPADSTEEVQESSGPLRYVVQNLAIKEGYIRYEDTTIPSVSELKSLNLQIPEIAWDNNQSQVGAGFVLGESGKVNIDGNLDQASRRYVIDLKTEDIDIAPFAGYFKPWVNASSIKGLLSASLKLTGDMENPMDIKVAGEGGLRDFSLTGPDSELFLSAKNAWSKIDSLDLARWNFCFSDVLIEQPVLHAVFASDSANFEKILAPYLADTLGTDSTQVHYTVRNLNIKDGAVAFSDLTLHRPFQFDVAQLDFNMRDLSDQSTRIPMEFAMILNRSGELKGTAEMNMINPMNLNLNGYVHNLDVVSFSPYSEYYLARPLTRGIFNYDLSLAMTPSSLENKNMIRIDKLEIGKRTKEKPVYKVPVGLALYVLKDRNDHIGFDLPVTGNPSSPKFKLRRIIWKTFEEFLLKTGTQPINFIGNKLGVDPESIRKIPFEFLQDSLDKGQIRVMDRIADMITKKPGLSFSLVQTTDPDEEKALIAVRSAKLLYASGGPGTDQAIISAPLVSSQDPGFLAFLGLNNEEPDTAGAGLRAACMQKIGADNVQEQFLKLLETREKLLADYLAGKALPEEAVHFRTADLRNLPEEMQSPQFVVEVSLQ